MGLTCVEATVTGPQGVSREVELLVDSGASYSLLPLEVWQELGLEAQKTLSFTLADGTKIDREASECKIRLNGKERHAPVTLENRGLVLDPFKRELRAMQLRLGRSAPIKAVLQ